MSEISILLVDDHPVVREGYRRLLERHTSFRVIAEAEDAASAYQAYRAARPDVVVMDLALPGAGWPRCGAAHPWDRSARILIFTMHASAAFALKAFESGVNGYIRPALGRRRSRTARNRDPPAADVGLDRGPDRRGPQPERQDRAQLCYQIKSKIGARTDAHLVWLATAAGLVTPENAG